MDGQDPIQRIEALARRVKAGQGTPADIAMLTSVRDQLASGGATNTASTVAVIDDALAAQATTAALPPLPAGPGDVPPTDWTTQPEIGGGPMPSSFSEALATGTPPTTFQTPPAPPAPAVFAAGESPLAGPNPWDVIGPGIAGLGDRLRDLQGTNIPSANQPLGTGYRETSDSVYDPGTLPPTQAPKGPDPLAAYQTAPTNVSPPQGTNMPGEAAATPFGLERETDWSDERRALKNEGLTPDERQARRAMGDTLTIPADSDSAFAGVTDITSVLYQPDMMARMIAKKMTGGKDSAMVAGMILPDVENALALVTSGQIGGGPRQSGIGPSSSYTDQLLAIEDFVLRMSGTTGTQVDPYAAYAEGLKRAQHTSQDQLQEKATSADPNAPAIARLTSQIDTTQEALLAGAGGMPSASYKKLKSRLDAAANEWLDIAMRSAPGTYQTYPQYLREQQAQNWFKQREE